MSNDLGSKRFSNGPHSGKTYLEIFQTDERFREMALGNARLRFIPDDFKQFVQANVKGSTSKHEIKERGCPHFVKACTPEIKQQLNNLLGDITPETRNVHPESNVIPNSNLGVFYHFFIKKCVFNKTNTDGYCKYINNYAAIFPFLVSEKISQCDVKIMDFLDEELSNEMQCFLNDHFDDIKVQSISKIFFVNILNFKEKNFSEKILSKALRNVRGLSTRNDENADINDNPFRRLNGPEERSDYLKNFPRVSRMGANRYKVMYDMFTNVLNLYRKSCGISPDKYKMEYLMNLPEINFFQLYSLLDPEFLLTERREYIYTFQKYLFFFINALKSDSKPVFFIDDVLFECLKSWKTFRTSRDDVLDIKYELAMMTLIYRRKQQFDERNDFRVDDENLREVKQYLENFPNISTAVIDYEVNTDVLETMIPISTVNACIDSCFRMKSRNKISDFYELILHGALSPKNIERLVMYNAFTGEESSIATPHNKEELIEFIRCYNKYDFSEKLPPEKFITWGQEKFYQGDVAAWDSRSFYKLF